MNKIEKIIAYLEGILDIYNGQYQDAINYWNSIWDEMKFMGYDPETVTGIKKYAKEQLS